MKKVVADTINLKGIDWTNKHPCVNDKLYPVRYKNFYYDKHCVRIELTWPYRVVAYGEGKWKFSVEFRTFTLNAALRKKDYYLYKHCRD